MKLTKTEIYVMSITALALLLSLFFGYMSFGKNIKGQGGSDAPLAAYSQIEFKVNLNNAPVEDIAAVEGISLQMAQDIVMYRNITPFTSINELMKIEGIDEQVLELIKGSITLVG